MAALAIIIKRLYSLTNYITKKLYLLFILLFLIGCTSYTKVEYIQGCFFKKYTANGKYYVWVEHDYIDWRTGREFSKYEKCIIENKKTYDRLPDKVPMRMYLYHNYDIVRLDGKSYIYYKYEEEEE